MITSLLICIFGRQGWQAAVIWQKTTIPSRDHLPITTQARAGHDPMILRWCSVWSRNGSGNDCRIINIHYSLFIEKDIHFPFSIVNYPLSIVHCQFSIFHCQFSIFHCQFSIFHCQFSIFICIFQIFVVISDAALLRNSPELTFALTCKLQSFVPKN